MAVCESNCVAAARPHCRTSAPRPPCGASPHSSLHGVERQATPASLCYMNRRAHTALRCPGYDEHTAADQVCGRQQCTAHATAGRVADDAAVHPVRQDACRPCNQTTATDARWRLLRMQNGGSTAGPSGDNCCCLRTKCVQGLSGSLHGVMRAHHARRAGLRSACGCMRVHANTPRTVLTTHSTQQRAPSCCCNAPPCAWLHARQHPAAQPQSRAPARQQQSTRPPPPTHTHTHARGALRYPPLTALHPPLQKLCCVQTPKNKRAAARVNQLINSFGQGSGE
jgi:hypothetical protein